MSNVKVCLIGGTGRSGTTILKKIFSSHPLTTTTPEGRLTIDPDGIVDFYTSIKNNWSPYIYHRKLERLIRVLREMSKRCGMRERLVAKVFPSQRPRYGNLAYSELCTNFDLLVNELEASLTEFRYDGSWVGMEKGESRELRFSEPSLDILRESIEIFLRGVYSGICKQDSEASEFYVEDNTWNFIHFDSILEMLPDAKLVHIHRDFRDVVASYVKQTWMPSCPLKSARILRSLLNRWEEVKGRLPQESYHEASLYDIVREPRSKIREVSDFWGVPWDESLMTTRLDRANEGRWKTQFSDVESEGVYQILEQHLRRYGYDT